MHEIKVSSVTLIKREYLKENAQQERKNLAEHYFKYDDNNVLNVGLFIN